MSAAYLTGAGGWLGGRLAQVLSSGLQDGPELPLPARVCGLLYGDELEETKSKADLELRRGSLLDSASLDRFLAGAEGAVLYHCAGLVHPSGRVRQFYEVNVEGTRNLLAAAAKAGVRRFVHVSSNSPMGCNPRPEHRFDEQAEYHPYMGYGRSKMEAELAVQAAGLERVMETVIVRPPWFYGPNQPLRQSTFFRMIRNGTVPLLGKGDNRRSMAYLDNLCQGLLLAGSQPQAEGEIYWIADRRAYAMSEIIDTIERVLEDDFGFEVAHKRLRAPGFIGDLASAADWAVQSVGLYHQKIHVLGEMNKSIACTVDKAVAELGYDPQVELAEGMRRSIGWLLEQGVEL